MKIFNLAAEKIRKSPFIIPITLVFIIMFLDSFGLSIEDYFTSYYGYMAFPTAKAIKYVAFLVALLPQLIQIGMVYVFIDDSQKRWALGIALIAHLLDIGTDVWFKINVGGQSHWEWIGFALLEAWGIYTLGSELMLTVSFGMIIKLWPDFWREILNVLKPILNLLSKILFWFIPILIDEKSNIKIDEEIPIKRGRGRPPKDELKKMIEQGREKQKEYVGKSNYYRPQNWNRTEENDEEILAIS